jgi:predicted DNA repair protein MutK
MWLLGKGRTLAAFGRGLLYATPWLMRGLSIAGTAAMFLVGGGILVHAIPALHHFVTGLAPAHLQWLANALGSVVVGIGVGALVLVAVTLFQRLRGGGKPAH